MSKVRVWCAGVAALALAACGQTSQSPSVSAPGSAPAASAPVSSADATVAPESSASAQPIASAVVAGAKLSGQACSLDTIEGSYDARVTLNRTKPHAFRGWLENDQQKAAGEFQIVLAGNEDFAIDAHTGIARPDVAASLHNPALADAGFNVAGNLDAVPVGEYRVQLLMQMNGNGRMCETKKSLTLD